MKTFKNPALVIGGGFTALNIIRNLGRNGIDVYCVVDDETDLAIYSKYCKGYRAVPGVASDLGTLKRFLRSYESRLTHKAVLFPSGDLSVLNLAHIIDEQDKYLAPIPSREAAETLIFKRKFYKSLQERGVPHPTTHYSDEEDVEDIVGEISFPVFIKPSVSPIFYEKFRRKGFVAYHEKDLRRYLQLVEKLNIDVVIQQIVLGPYTNHYGIMGYFDSNSKPVNLFAKKNLRQPTPFSVTTAGISIPLSKVLEIKEKIVDYLTSLRYHGLFSDEWKRDTRDGIFKLLEVNARTVWANAFPSQCGINQVLSAYLDAVGEENNSTDTYEVGTYYVNGVYDLFSCKEMLLRGELSLRDLIKSHMRKRHWVVYAKDDPRPFIQLPYQALIKRIRAKTRIS